MVNTIKKKKPGDVKQYSCMDNDQGTTHTSILPSIYQFIFVFEQCFMEQPLGQVLL